MTEEASAIPAPAHSSLESRVLIRIDALPAERHPVAVYLSSLGPGSRRTMRQALGAIAQLASGGRADARTLKWEALRYQHCQAIRAALAEKFAPATANKMLAALRGVLKESWRLGLTSAENYHRAVDVRAIKSSTLPRGRALSSGELRALFEACADGTKAGVRDAALFGVLDGGGLCRSEAVWLDLGDYQPETGALTIRGAKGQKDRIVYASNGSADALADWIALRGSEQGALFHPVNKGDRIVPRRLTDQAVLGIVRKRAEVRLELTRETVPRGIGPHCARSRRLPGHRRSEDPKLLDEGEKSVSGMSAPSLDVLLTVGDGEPGVVSLRPADPESLTVTVLFPLDDSTVSLTFTVETPMPISELFRK